MQTLEKNEMRPTTLFILLLVVSQCFADEDFTTRLGMWVWPEEAFSTEAAREKLLAFCAEQGITHLDQHAGIENSDSMRSLKNADMLIELVVAAREKGVTVNALRGSPKMFFQKNHEETLADLRAIIAFDKRLPPTARLAGVKYDVEPYGTEEWKAGGEQRLMVMMDYLTFLQKAKVLLQEKAPHLELSVDVPLWWDSPKFAVEFAGEKKFFVHHIQEQTDYIGIMSYRPSAGEIISVVQGELDYASTIRKTICPGIETGEILGKESWISFWDRPQADFRQTVNELQQTFSGNKAVRCIMLHHYNSLLPYLENTPNKPEQINR